MEVTKLTIPIHEKKHTDSSRIFKDRERTNILKKAEQKTISYLVTKIPESITSNTLTAIGTVGCGLVLLGFILAAYFDRNYLLLGVAGLAINWFGDSLDGRIAYYRNIPRKWFGFALDILMDWIGTAMIGLGYLIYSQQEYGLLPFLFVVLYAWAMIIALLRYKITGKYAIDSGLAGPTEVRILISLILISEVVFVNSINLFAIAMCAGLFIINSIETRKLLEEGNIRDLAEKKDLKNLSN